MNCVATFKKLKLHNYPSVFSNIQYFPTPSILYLKGICTNVKFLFQVFHEPRGICMNKNPGKKQSFDLTDIFYSNQIAV